MGDHACSAGCGTGVYDDAYGAEGAEAVAGGGWSILTTETRVVALDDLTRRGMGRYWRLMVPGSGLLRHQWLDAIKKRAEKAPQSAADFPSN